MKNATTPPLLGFCAYSGTGKTTLLKSLIPCLTKAGLNLGVIKHAHHDFDTDQPGKDSYELRKAGAQQMLVSSARRNVLITELTKDESEPTLDVLVARFNHSKIDLILVEGFKRVAFKKIELFRPKIGKPPMYSNDPNIIAIATDQPLNKPAPIPVFDLNKIDDIARFIINDIVRAR